MRKLKSVIVDDMTANIETLQSLIDVSCPTVYVAGYAQNVEEAYEVILLERPDIVFLDIELQNATGFDLLNKFSNVFFEVVFTTAYSQYAINAFRENAIDYLLKPIRIKELQQAVEKTISKIELNALRNLPPVNTGLNRISLPTQEGYVFVNLDDIMHCEASGSYTIFYLSDNTKVTVSLRLKIFENKLPEHQFLRVHHSHIVNLNFVVKYFRGKGGYITLTNGKEIEISASKKETFLKIMNQQL